MNPLKLEFSPDGPRKRNQRDLECERELTDVRRLLLLRFRGPSSRIDLGNDFMAMTPKA